jgi:hypothetical protein
LSYSRPIAATVYDARALKLGAVSLNAFSPEISKLPSIPTEHEFSGAAAIKLQLCLYVIGIVRSAQEVGKSAQLVWFAGQFLTASALIRMLVELCGAAAYAEDKVLRKVEAAEIHIALDRVTKLVLGSKTGASFRPGEKLEHPAVNVLDFVRAAEARWPGIMDDYSFLCDAAHPSYVQNSLLLFAGADYDNWDNKAFATHAHEILDRTLRVGETALQGIESVGLDIFSRCVPSILAEAQ